MKTAASEHRQDLPDANRVVVKVGSRVLVQRSGRPDRVRIRALVKEVARLHRAGREVVLVTSGAIGAGMEALGLKRRPTTLPDLQMAAAVGQTRLMTLYGELFQKERIKVGQVLLTHADLNDRRRHLNARNTMMNLLRNRILPIVNENDVVSVDEIKLGDNDMLASLVSLLIQADAMVMLTVTNGIRIPATSGRTRRAKTIFADDASVHAFMGGTSDGLSVGGMATKFQAAEDVARNGIPAVIADGRKAGTITRVLEGHDEGTMVALHPDKRAASLSGRKKWIAFFHRAHGTLVIDDGARDAIIKKGKSLLPIGIQRVEGPFSCGDVVNIRTLEGDLIARGLVEYDAADVQVIKGHRTTEIPRLLGSKDYDEVIHRDNMVVLRTKDQVVR